MKFLSELQSIISEQVNFKKEVELRESLATHYKNGYDAQGKGKTRQDNPHREGTPAAAMWAKGWEHASDGKEPQKFANDDAKKQDMVEMDNRTLRGDRREQRANSPEAIAQRKQELQAKLKKVSPEMRKKLRLPDPKEGVAEGSEQKKPLKTHKSGCGYNYGHDCDCGGTLTHASNCHYNYGHDCDCGLDRLKQQKQNKQQGVAEGTLNEFVPGPGYGGWEDDEDYDDYGQYRSVAVAIGDLRKFSPAAAKHLIRHRVEKLIGQRNIDMEKVERAYQDALQAQKKFSQKSKMKKEGVAEETEQIDEVSMEKMLKYVPNAVKDLSNREIRINTGKATANDAKKVQDRKKGLNRAAGKIGAKMAPEGVAEGLGKNVVKSVKVGNFRHDLVDTGMGWQVRIYNSDQLYDTGLSKNSEQKGLAALEDAIAYTEKQTNTKRQGVVEGSAKSSSAYQHHVVSKLDGNVLASYKTREEAHKNAHGNPVVSGSLETISDRKYVREQGVAEAKGALTYTPEFKKWAVIPKSRKQFVTFFKPNEEKKAQEFAQSSGGRLVKVDQMDRVIKDCKKA